MRSLDSYFKEQNVLFRPGYEEGKLPPTLVLYVAGRSGSVTRIRAELSRFDSKPVQGFFLASSLPSVHMAIKNITTSSPVADYCPAHCVKLKVRGAIIPLHPSASARTSQRTTLVICEKFQACLLSWRVP